MKEDSFNSFLSDGKDILDACCGGRMFWFDKQNPYVLFTDCRSEEFTTGDGKHERNRKVLPDQIEDFRNMSHPNDSFKMVVFDPPHLFVGENSYMGRIYGRLDRNTWKEDFKERVLQNVLECLKMMVYLFLNGVKVMFH